MGDDCRRHGAGDDGIDRISGLPDDLLRRILLRLGSTRAAARTSVLSRRWRCVWPHMPDLRLGTCDDPHPGATRLDTVDAALAAYNAPAARRLDVAMHCHGLRVQARQVAPWLRFAAQRRVAKLNIDLPSQTRFLFRADATELEEELQLPVWEDVRRITVTLERRWRLRPHPAGVFAALSDLSISLVTMKASELGDLVSSQCPRLKNLYLFLTLQAASSNVVSIRSDSLLSLVFRVGNVQRLEVVAPNLEELIVSDATEAHVSSPKLGEVTWSGDIAYDPRRHYFADAGRHLRLLDLGSKCVVASLLQRFDKVDVLKLTLNLCDETQTEGYMKFVNETTKLPECGTLRLRLTLGDYYHNLASSMLHLLRSCNSTGKLSVKVDYNLPMQRYSRLMSWHCRLPESCKTDDITLDALEEAKITLIRSSYEEVQFVEQLARCRAPSLKKLVIKCERCRNGPPTKEIQEKVRRLFLPDVEVKFNVT